MSSSQHPVHGTNRASTNYTEPSDMSVTEPLIHELQARLTYHERMSPSLSSQNQPNKTLLGLSGASGLAGHRPTRSQGSLPDHTYGASWGSHTTTQPQYQGFGEPSKYIQNYQDPMIPSTMPPPSSGSRRSSPQRPLSSSDISVEEDKRRRNTEASAKFRAKKVQRLQDLEKAIPNMQKKADELEKEVAELRRENLWLKQMLITKRKRRSTPGQGVSGKGRGKHDKNIDESNESDG